MKTWLYVYEYRFHMEGQLMVGEWASVFQHAAVLYTVRRRSL
jgi:hypothetical protein